MELTGTIKLIKETQFFGENRFAKREMVLETAGEYPQPLLIEFVQDKCDLLDQFKIGQDVKIAINLRGREWTNPEGKVRYFNSIQGWRIQAVEAESNTLPELEAAENGDDLPF